MSFLSMMSMICNGLMFICIFFMYLFIYIFSFLSFVLILLEMWPNVAIQFQQFLGGFRSGSGNPWPGEACLFGLLTFHAHLFLTDETCGLFFKPQLPPSITLAQAQMARPINQVSGYFMFLNLSTFSRGFWTPLSGEKVGKKRMKSRNWWKQSSFIHFQLRIPKICFTKWTTDISQQHESPTHHRLKRMSMWHATTTSFWSLRAPGCHSRHCLLQHWGAGVTHGAEFFHQIWVPHLSRIDTGWKTLQRIFQEQKLCRFQFLFPLFEAATVRRFVPAPTSQSYFRLRRHKVFFGVTNGPRIHKFWFTDFLSTWTDGWIEDLNTFFIFVSYCVWGVINCVASACFVLGCWLIVVTNSEISAMSDLGSKQLLQH